ncbi:Hypothetical predicted protein [Cloeon dipterum]|uniref:Bee-milk protein n=1 Tax=Cloeon dipterum TaxID=197152 RepID=A0A8S1DHU3_9INSE|nr:Hypothetical predicted protein [Cloeon dipterum]
MTPFFVAILLLGISSLAAATNFTKVFEWNELDYEWPSEARRSQALNNGFFKPEEIIEPLYMAVYESRVFLSLHRYGGIPVSLVSLPTSSASSMSPKLPPFPSWDMHEFGNCNKIEMARGLEVDSVGRLWVLDDGSSKCNSKIWTIDLTKNDQTKLMHQLPSIRHFNDLVLDETPNDTFLYIPLWFQQSISVFSLERNETWTAMMHIIKSSYSIALSPNGQEPRQLYFCNNLNELFSISVTALRSATQCPLYPKLIAKWAGKPYRMMMDNHGTLYSALFFHSYVLSWNTSQPFQGKRFYEFASLNSFNTFPFTIALDQNGTIWMTVVDTNNGEKPRYRLLKASDSEPSLEASSGKFN